MTSKTKIQAEYQLLAANAGDLYFKLQEAEAAVQRLKAELSESLQRKQSLEKAYKDASDEPVEDASSGTE